MRSIRVLTGLAFAGAALTLSVPAAQAAPDPDSEICEQAQVAADEAQKEYDNLKMMTGVSKEKLDDAENEVNLTASEAQRVCGDSVADKVTGPVHTGLGGGSDSDSATLAGGVAVLVVGVAGGAVMLRRRDAAGQR
ncbi:hypothetical protein [Streptomyces sp. A5-4]|uniref:hypothetical protein n=1 Tax=Streptomyces sp. A5-4 TaxID=3384771 RepID=UPI003DA97CD0